MKRILQKTIGAVLSLALMMSFVPSTSIAATSSNKVNAKPLHIRPLPLYKSASASSQKLATIWEKDWVQILEYSPKKVFTKVKFGKLTGYYYTYYLRVNIGVLNREGIETIKPNATTVRSANFYTSPLLAKEKRKLGSIDAKKRMTVLQYDFNKSYDQSQKVGKKKLYDVAQIMYYDKATKSTYVGYIFSNALKLDDGVPIKGQIPIKVSSVKMSQQAAAMSFGETLQLKATVAPRGAGNKTVEWSSSDETICTVDQNGLVTAVAHTGEATITAKSTDGTNKSACTLITLNLMTE